MKTELKMDTVRDAGDYVVIAIRGEATFADSDRMKRTLLGEAEASGRRGIIIDCSDLGYLDSSGLGIVVALYTTLKRKQGRLILAGMQPTLISVLEASRLRKLIPNTRSLEEATEDMHNFLGKPQYEEA